MFLGKFLGVGWERWLVFLPITVASKNVCLSIIFKNEFQVIMICQSTTLERTAACSSREFSHIYLRDPEVVKLPELCWYVCTNNFNGLVRHYDLRGALNGNIK